MVDKFYFEILEQHLKQAETIKPYREELEARTRDFNDYINDVFDGRGFSKYHEAAPEAAATDQPTPPEDPNQAAEGQRKYGLIPSKILKLEEESRLYARLAALSYFMNDLVKKYSENGIAQNNSVTIKKEFENSNKNYKMFMQEFVNDTHRDSQQMNYDALSALTPAQAKKFSVFDKVLVSLANNSKPFKDAFGESTDTNALLDDTVKKAVTKELNEILNEPKFKIPTTLNSHPAEARDVIVYQLETQPFSPEQYDKFMKLGDDLELKGFSKTFGKGGDYSAKDRFAGGDLTATDVIDVLQQTQKLDDVVNGAFKAFSNKVPSIAETLNTVANKVFQGQVVGANPIKNEEHTLMDVINDHVFFGDVSKKKLTNSKFWNEATNDTYDNPTANYAQTNEPLNQSGKANTGTAVGAPTAGPQNEPKEAKPQTQEQPKQQTKPDTNAMSIAKNNAMRQAVATVTLTTIMSFLAAFTDHFGKLVGNATEPLQEEAYEEGVLGFLTKGIGGTFKALGSLVHNLTSVIPTDLNDMNDKAVFDKVVTVLLKQAKSGALNNILTQFNVSKQDLDFNSKLFNPKILNKHTGPFNEAIAKARVDTERALGQFNETSLQKIVQNAYLSGANKGVKAAYKVAGAVDKLKTKIQGV